MIKDGRITLEDVPSRWYDEVKRMLEEDAAKQRT